MIKKKERVKMTKEGGKTTPRENSNAPMGNPKTSFVSIGEIEVSTPIKNESEKKKGPRGRTQGRKSQREKIAYRRSINE